MKKIVNGQPVDMTQAEITAFNNRTVPIPFSVTPRQMRLALLQGGMMAQVNAYVANLPDVAKIEWEYATSVERTSPLIAAAAAGLGLDAGQVDNLFVLAASL